MTPRETVGGLSAPITKEKTITLSGRLDSSQRDSSRSHRAEDIEGMHDTSRRISLHSDASSMGDVADVRVIANRRGSHHANLEGLRAKQQERSNAETRPETPSQAELRIATRHLKQRRSQPAVVDAAGGLSGFIRSRTTATVNDVRASESVAADLTRTREVALQRARLRLEELQRAYDALHAECIGKEQVRPNMHSDRAQSTLRPSIVQLLPPSPRALPTLRVQMHHTLQRSLKLETQLGERPSPRSARVTAIERAARPKDEFRRQSEAAFHGPTSRASFNEAVPSEEVADDAEDGAEVEDEDVAASARPPLATRLPLPSSPLLPCSHRTAQVRNAMAASLVMAARWALGAAAGANPTLATVAHRAGLMQDKLRAIEANLDVLDHMERRTIQLNHTAAAKLAELHIVVGKVDAEAKELNIISAEASDSLKAAQLELAQAKEAIKEQAKAYLECKKTRQAVNKEHSNRSKRQAENLLASKETRLQAKGDLDAAGELELKVESNQIGGKALAEKLEKESTVQKTEQLDELYTRLRLAMPDPSSIETPQDLLDAALAASDRKQNLQADADSAVERNELLREECAKREEELRHVMFFGSTAAALAKAERAMQPNMEAASHAKEVHARKLLASQRLAWDAQAGLALLLHKCQLDVKLDEQMSDDQLMPSIEKFERHLVWCLSQGQTPAAAPAVEYHPPSRSHRKGEPRGGDPEQAVAPAEAPAEVLAEAPVEASTEAEAPVQAPVEAPAPAAEQSFSKPAEGSQRRENESVAEPRGGQKQRLVPLSAPPRAAGKGSKHDPAVIRMSGRITYNLRVPGSDDDHQLFDEAGTSDTEDAAADDDEEEELDMRRVLRTEKKAAQTQRASVMLQQKQQELDQLASDRRAYFSPVTLA